MNTPTGHLSPNNSSLLESSALTAGSNGMDYLNYNIEGIDLSDSKR